MGSGLCQPRAVGRDGHGTGHGERGRRTRDEDAKYTGTRGDEVKPGRAQRAALNASAHPGTGLEVTHSKGVPEWSGRDQDVAQALRCPSLSRMLATSQRMSARILVGMRRVEVTTGPDFAFAVRDTRSRIEQGEGSDDHIRTGNAFNWVPHGHTHLVDARSDRPRGRSGPVDTRIGGPCGGRTTPLLLGASAGRARGSTSQ